MALIKIDEEKCIKCLACAKECPNNVIILDGQKKLAQSSQRSCIACGHCVAVCPTQAIDNRKSPLAGQQSLEGWSLPEAGELKKILRSRRSIRTYKDKLVEQEKIEQILDVARYAQTGGNSQGLSFLVFSSRQVLVPMVEATIGWMEDAMKKEDPMASYFEGVVSSYKVDGLDSILRGAQHVAVAIAPKNHRSAQTNCNFTFSYAELFAPSLGVGTCIAGFMQYCAFNKWAPLMDLLQIPDNMDVAGVLMMGYPQYKYHRLVERQKLKVEFR